MVQCMKRPLRKVLGSALVNRKELECILAELQTVINLRPLCKPSVDAEDADPLTPASLMGKTFNDEPAIELTKGDMNRRQLYLSRISQGLRQRWRSEYLSKLLLSKNNYDATPPRVDDTVLVQDDWNPRNKWPMARILEAVPGPDGVVRLVKLVNSSGFIFYRAVHRLLPLEVDLPPAAEMDTLTL